MEIFQVVESIQPDMDFDRLVSNILQLPIPNENVEIMEKTVTPEEFEIISGLAYTYRAIESQNLVSQLLVEFISTSSTRLILGSQPVISVGRLSSVVNQGFKELKQQLELEKSDTPGEKIPDVYRTPAILASCAFAISLFMSCIEPHEINELIRFFYTKTYPHLTYDFGGEKLVLIESPLMNVYKSIYRLNLPNPQEQFSLLYEQGFNRHILSALVK